MSSIENLIRQGAYPMTSEQAARIGQMFTYYGGPPIYMMDAWGCAPVRDEDGGVTDERATLEKLADQITPNRELFLADVNRDYARLMQSRYGELNVLYTDSYELLRPGANTVSRQAFGLSLCNPPYDQGRVGDRSTSAATRRMEYKALIRATKFVQPGGYIVFVCYDMHISEYVADEFIKMCGFRTVDTKKGREMRPNFVTFFLDKHMGKYNQMVIVGKIAEVPYIRSDGEQGQFRSAVEDESINRDRLSPFARTKFHMLDLAKDGTKAPRLPDVGKFPMAARFELPPPNVSRSRLKYMNNRPDPEVSIRIKKQFAPIDKRLLESMAKPYESTGIINPVLKPKQGIYLALVRSGLMNNTVLKNKETGKWFTIRSITRTVQRWVAEKTQLEHTATGPKVTEYMRYEPQSQIYWLDEDGADGVLAEDGEIISFVEEHRAAISEQIDAKFNEQYRMEMSPLFQIFTSIFRVKEFSPEHKDEADPYGRGGHSLLTTQKFAVEVSAMRALLAPHAGNHMLRGEPSTGKSIMTISTAVALFSMANLAELDPEFLFLALTDPADMEVYSPLEEGEASIGYEEDDSHELREATPDKEVYIPIEVSEASIGYEEDDSYELHEATGD